MSAEWSLVWGRGNVVLEDARLVIQVGRKRHAIELAGATIRLARWSMGGSLFAGAAVVIHHGGRVVSVAGAFTPRCTQFDGAVSKPTAIVAPESLKELIEALGDRIATTEVDREAPFVLVPRATGTALWIAFAVLTTGMMIPKAFETGSAGIVAGTIAAFFATAAITYWLLQRTRKLTLVVDDTHLVATARPPLGYELRGERAKLEGAIGHTAITSRYGSSKAPAIAFTIGTRRITVQSMEATQNPHGIRLGGWIYMLPADEHERLRNRLRLR
jgi:hypothetical protein